MKIYVLWTTGKQGSHLTLTIAWNLSSQKRKNPVVNCYLAQLHLLHRGSMTFWGVQCCFEKRVSEPKLKKFPDAWFSRSLGGHLPGRCCQFPLTAKASAWRGSQSARPRCTHPALFLELSLFSWLGKRPVVTSQISVLMVGSSPMPCFFLARYSL